MEIVCPYCRHAEADAFELFEPNEFHDDFVCVACLQPFAAFITNCIRCDFEEAMTWPVDARPASLDLPCANCGYLEVHSDARDSM